MGRFLSTLSIRWRLTSTYVALVVAIVLVLGLALYAGLQSFLLDDVAARTSADVQRVVALELDQKPGRKPPAPAGTPSAAVDALAKALVAQISGRDTSVLVLAPDGSILAASTPVPDVAAWPVPTPAEVSAATASGQAVRRIDGGRQPRAMLVVDAIRDGDGTLLAVAAVATSLEGGDGVLAQLRLALVIGLVAAILLGVALGLPITRIALRPLDRVVGAAQRISAGDRTARVGAADVPTEIGRLGVAFDTMVDRLESAAQAQRRFVADASHELRTPLAALGGMTEMLLLGIDQGDEAVVERVLTAMNREIGRLGRLASDLLLLSQFEDRGGRLPLVVGQVAVADVAHEVVAELDSAVDGRLVRVDIQPGLVIAGDRDRLKQVLLNLVENAARHTEPGGSIVVSAVPVDGGPLDGAPTGATSPGGPGRVRISVTDDGTGLVATDLQHIFDRFFRADQARVRAGGAGLGLSIVRAIAEAHGGYAEASSKGLGLGTTVSIVIPTAAATTAATAPTPGRPVPRPSV